MLYKYICVHIYYFNFLQNHHRIFLQFITLLEYRQFYINLKFPKYRYGTRKLYQKKQKS
jgi:hypothetical protein